MTSKVAIGIYHGPTSTRIVMIDSDLRILVQSRHVQAIGSMIREAGQIEAIGIATHHESRTKYGDILPKNIPHFVEQRAVAALIAGASRQFGVVTMCDDDTLTLGVANNGQREQVASRGDYFNSSYEIGRDVLQAICDAFDGIGGSTTLTDRALQRLNLHTQSDLLAWLKDRSPQDIASFADEAIALEDRDAIATGIISRAADRLAAQVQSVARRLQMNDEWFPLVMAGSLFTRSGLLQTLFSQAVQTAFPGAAPHLLTHDFAVCAAAMAFDRVGIALPQLDLSENAPCRATERRNPLTMDIQQRPTSDFVRLMNSEDQRVPRLIEPQLERIAALIDGAAERYEKGGRLFFVGAGTSGRLAVLDAAECRPTFGTTLEEVAGILAGGEAAMINSIEGAEDDEAQGRAEIATRTVGKLDTVIGIAASGSTPFVIGAVREAQDRGALTGCIVNNIGSVIASLVQHPIVITTGPEVIMGSTRLKAGTAQKLVLNMISTGVMMRVGKTYGNLMTDMQMSNIKLRKRAAVIVAEATDLPLDAATELLSRCDNEMKTAIAAHLLKLSPAEARSRLQTYNGNLYRCIQASSAK